VKFDNHAPQKRQIILHSWKQIGQIFKKVEVTSSPSIFFACPL